jgi:urease accessory protein
MAHVILANPTAGLLSGDRHVIDVSVTTGARAHVTTQAATKVFSMPDGRAEQRLTLRVEEGGLLEYLSHAVIPFRAARLDQRAVISVASGGSVIYADVLSLRRVQSGERLVFRSIASRLTVRRPSGQELYLESYLLEPEQGSLDAPGVLGVDNAAAVGTLIIVTDQNTPEVLIDAVRSSVERALTRVGAAPLPGGGGIVVKTIAESASAAEAMLFGVVRRVTR